MSLSPVKPVTPVFQTVTFNEHQYAKRIKHTLGFADKLVQVFEDAFRKANPDVDLKSEEGEKAYEAWSETLTGSESNMLWAQAVYVPIGDAPPITELKDFIPSDDLAEAISFLLSKSVSNKQEQTGSASSTLQENPTSQGQDSAQNSPLAGKTS